MHVSNFSGPQNTTWSLNGWIIWTDTLGRLCFVRASDARNQELSWNFHEALPFFLLFFPTLDLGLGFLGNPPPPPHSLDPILSSPSSSPSIFVVATRQRHSRHQSLTSSPKLTPTIIIVNIATDIGHHYQQLDRLWLSLSLDIGDSHHWHHLRDSLHCSNHHPRPCCSLIGYLVYVSLLFTCELIIVLKVRWLPRSFPMVLAETED